MLFTTGLEFSTACKLMVSVTFSPISPVVGLTSAPAYSYSNLISKGYAFVTASDFTFNSIEFCLVSPADILSI